MNLHANHVMYVKSRRDFKFTYKFIWVGK